MAQFKFAIQTLDVKYEGKMSGDGKSIAGTFTQGAMSTPLLFERATPETEWVIPPPPPKTATHGCGCQSKF